MTDRLVIGYSDDERGQALVVLRPVDPEHSMEFEELYSCTNNQAKTIYDSIICGNKLSDRYGAKRRMETS